MATIDYNIPAKSGVRPSVFEVFAVQSLSNGLRTAFDYLLKVLSENHPDRYGLVYRHRNGCYAVFDVAVQHYCLKTYNGAFAENFYGLRRVPASGCGKLSGQDLYRSLLLIVAVPYLKVLLDAFYKKETDSQETTSHGGGAPKWRRLFIWMYPFVHLIAQTVSVTYQLMYASSKWKHPSPELHLSSTQLRALTAEDLAQSRHNLGCRNVRSLPEMILQAVASGLSTGVSFGAFFLQFLDWWYNREGVSYSFQPLPIPPPPSKYSIGTICGICPLCFENIKCETLLTTSGYVFCFGCIYPRLEKCCACPVTRLPSTTEHLIRLYIPTD